MSGIRNLDDQFSEEDISDLITGGFSLATVNGQLVLSTSWQAITNPIPSDDYLIVIGFETVAGTVRFAFSNTGSPSTTNGVILPTDGLSIAVPGNQTIYFASTNAGDTLNYSYRLIV